MIRKIISLAGILLLLSTTSTYAVGSTYSYIYDQNSRLLQIQREGQTIGSYTYDANGNRTQSISNLFTDFGRFDIAVQSDGTMLVENEPNLEPGPFALPLSQPDKNILSQKQATGNSYSVNFALSPNVILYNTISNTLSKELNWEGTSSVKVSRIDNNVPYFAVDKVLPSTSAGQPFTFSAYVNSNISTTSVTAGYLDEHGTMTPCGAPVTPNGRWTRVTCTTEGKLGPDEQVHLQFYLSSQSSNFGTSYSYYVDGLQLEQASAATAWTKPSVRGTAIRVEGHHGNQWGNPSWKKGVHNWQTHSTDGAEGTHKITPISQTIVLAKTDSGIGQWGVQQSKNSYNDTFTDAFRFKKISSSEGSMFKSYTNYTMSDGTSIQAGFEINLSDLTVVSINGGTLKFVEDVDGWYRAEYTTSKFPVRATSWQSFLLVEGGPATVALDTAQKEIDSYAHSFTPQGISVDKIITPLPRPISGKKGTVEMMVYLTKEHLATPTKGYIFFQMRGNKTDTSFHRGIRLSRSIDPNAWQLLSTDDTGAGTPIYMTLPNLKPGWHRFAITWSPAKLAFYVDGQLAGAKDNPRLPEQISYGLSYGTGFQASPAYTVLDDIRFSSIARTAEELSASYLANQPLPVDSYTLYKSRFNEL